MLNTLSVAKNIDQDLVLKISNNLHVVGTKVISYETYVADIKLGSKGLDRRVRVIADGKFSRTTTKQLSQLADLLGARVESAHLIHQLFDRLQCGVSIRIKGALSRDASRTIIKKLATGNSLHDSTVASIPSFNKTDLAKLLTYTEGNPKLKEQVETVLFLAKIGITG
jgi:hypothetical protein